MTGIGKMCIRDRICSVGCDLYLLDPFIAGSICAGINDGSQSLINRNFGSFQKSGNVFLQSGDGCLIVLSLIHI